MKKDIVLISNQQLELFRMLAMNFVRQQTTRNGFRPNHIPNMLLFPQKEEEINNIILRQALGFKYGDIIKDISVKKMLSNIKNKNVNTFELELFSNDPAILDNLIPTKEYENYINSMQNQDNMNNESENINIASEE